MSSLNALLDEVEQDLSAQLQTSAFVRDNGLNQHAREGLAKAAAPVILEERLRQRFDWGRESTAQRDAVLTVWAQLHEWAKRAGLDECLRPAWLARSTAVLLTELGFEVDEVSVWRCVQWVEGLGPLTSSPRFPE